MSDHSELLKQYKRIREVQFRLNNFLAKKVPKEILEECGRKLGIFQKGTFVLDSMDEMSVLMDYCLYYPQSDGKNLVEHYLEQTPPTADPEETAFLQAMTHAYYSLFQVTDVERGLGVSVQDLLRGEPGFIVDVGFGNSAERNMAVATRVIPRGRFLTTGGAALPLDGAAGKRILDELIRTNQTPDALDFHTISRRQEADIAALIIRTSLAEGMASRIAYHEPGSSGPPGAGSPEDRRRRDNARCPCGSGKKYRACCGRR
jgi:hypothetical protein